MESLVQSPVLVETAETTGVLWKPGIRVNCQRTTTEDSRKELSKELSDATDTVANQEHVSEAKLCLFYQPHQFGWWRRRSLASKTTKFGASDSSFFESPVTVLWRLAQIPDFHSTPVICWDCTLHWWLNMELITVYVCYIWYIWYMPCYTSVLSDFCECILLYLNILCWINLTTPLAAFSPSSVAAFVFPAHSKKQTISCPLCQQETIH